METQRPITGPSKQDEAMKVPQNSIDAQYVSTPGDVIDTKLTSL